MEKTGTPSPHAIAMREEKRRAAAAMGIDDHYVSELVDRFYDKIRADAVLGPIFAERISDWGPHLDQMKRFWRSILFSSGEYLGRPMPKHLAIPGLDKPLFARWLDLFAATLAEIGGGDAAAHVHERARMIANSFLNGIAIHHHGQLGLREGEGFA
ncbi:group III truncated hemoglobin [Sphingomonas soli]|uniref:group III truncated hemoglobin n=1 Tax=Sphingomonas soli TaxID=266127 RepID=UPI000A062DE2|nr:group III truncated hemoglobin [Sphingomonas soli]